MGDILDRFLRYIAIDTRSDEGSPSQPSAKGELKLSSLLADELREMGLDDVILDEYGYVMATLPASQGCGNWPVIGFLAHVDTSPDAPGACLKPQIVSNYDGGDIPLRGVRGLVLSPKDFPEMLRYKGLTLITTDGTTLLGADDKAGVAEIMYAVEYLLNHPGIKHGPVRIGFTPDEEIGRGVDAFDVKRFGADYAYTVDGGEIGELEFENFNAASAKVSIRGRNVHPGYAKGKMINAISVAEEFDLLLPHLERPEYTSGYEGFFHLVAMSGTVENASLSYIVRDHDKDMFTRRKAAMQNVADKINSRYGEGTATLVMKDQYYNMREAVEPHYHIVEKAIEAMKMAGIKPKVQPIRGGTDGAKLSFMGLPCPNIFAGGLNFHGKMEFIPLESMEKAAEVIINLVKSS